MRVGGWRFDGKPNLLLYFLWASVADLLVVFGLGDDLRGGVRIAPPIPQQERISHGALCRSQLAPQDRTAFLRAPKRVAQFSRVRPAKPVFSRYLAHPLH